MMTQERISGNSAVAVQGILMFFLIPFVLFVSYIIISKSFDTPGFCILITLIVVIFIIIKGSLFYGDIYLTNNIVTVKKITGSKERSISEVKSIKKSLIPFVYYIEFLNTQKVYFTIKPTDVLKQIVSMDSGTILQVLNSKFRQESSSVLPKDK
jgi:hypothetical protein